MSRTDDTPLVDPETPAGFFHFRLLPYRRLALSSGRHPGFPGIAKAQDSYFIAPPEVECVPENGPLGPVDVAKATIQHWETSAPLLAEMSANLPQLAARLTAEEPDASENREPVSNYVYPLI